MRNLLAIPVPAILVLLLLAAPVSADADPLDDPWYVAWLAWYAGETGDASHLNDLKCVLRRPIRSAAERFSRMHVLDALIRLKANVGRKELLPALRAGWFATVPVTILAVRHSDPETRLAVFARLHESEEDAWVALGNVLARERTPGFAAQALTRLSTELRIYVSDDSDYQVEQQRVPRWYLSGSRIVHLPGGMPPLPLYWTSETDYDWADQQVISSGYQTIYSARTTKEGSSFLWSDGSGRLDCHAAVRHWVGVMLDRKPEIEWPGERIGRRVIHPTSDKVYWRRIRYARQDVEVLYWKLADQFVRARLLTRAEADAFEPEIERTILDVRRRKKHPLPPPEPPPPPTPRPRPKKPVRLR